MYFLEALRAANIARNDEWQNKDVPFSTIFWANELGGEAGEACNILKKLDRELVYKVAGSRAALPALTEELADVVICADLLAMNRELTLPEACWPTYPKAQTVDYSRLGATLMARVGRVCAIFSSGNPAPLLLLPSILGEVVTYTKTAADWLGLDLEKALTTKFNMTSEKIGLATRLEWTPEIAKLEAPKRVKPAEAPTPKLSAAMPEPVQKPKAK